MDLRDKGQFTYPSHFPQFFKIFHLKYSFLAPNKLDQNCQIHRCVSDTQDKPSLVQTPLPKKLQVVTKRIADKYILCVNI